MYLCDLQKSFLLSQSTLDKLSIEDISVEDILAMGSSGMVESPTTALQSYITYGGNSQGFGGGAFRPGGPGNSQGQTSSITANSQVVITDASGNELIRFTAPKTISYILYSSPVLTSNASYQFLANGTTLSTVTAK